MQRTLPLPPAVARAIERAVGDRVDGPILRNVLGGRMDRHAASRRLRHPAIAAGVRMPRMHPHMLRHTFVTTMLDAGVSLRDVQIAARHADPRTTMRYDRARNNLDRHPQLHPRRLHGVRNLTLRFATMPRSGYPIRPSNLMNSWRRARSARPVPGRRLSTPVPPGGGARR
ncbi:tyrosine-type recombinase/integrase [Dactylosporangium sp. NPDC049140]|uniref:tyrosine-type recombinase/integrase n=1 Tax=Dactylosporangium sp. NPDC049140 TaxID=3155647 RepID=UPI0033F39BAE